MKIFTPGFPVRYIDEEAPVNEAPVAKQETQVLAFPSIEDAIKLAEARSSAAVANGVATPVDHLVATVPVKQTITFPTTQQPLVDNNAPGAKIDSAVNVSAFIEQKATADAAQAVKDEQAKIDAELLK